jgi:hypothetical protein
MAYPTTAHVVGIWFIFSMFLFELPTMDVFWNKFFFVQFFPMLIIICSWMNKRLSTHQWWKEPRLRTYYDVIESNVWFTNS